jgi:outer membrane lipoprotein SlyB
MILDDTARAVHTPELVLDFYSVDLNGKVYRTITSNVIEKGRETVGANERTAVYAGSGAGLGALLGGILGGGRGAGIGAGGGALTQLFTRRKRVTVPAETTITFRLDRTLVLPP